LRYRVGKLEYKHSQKEHLKG